MMNQSQPILVAVLRRAIAADGILVDTQTHVVREDETVHEVMAWADRVCCGSAVLVSLEITKSVA